MHVLLLCEGCRYPITGVQLQKVVTVIIGHPCHGADYVTNKHAEN